MFMRSFLKKFRYLIKKVYYYLTGNDISQRYILRKIKKYQTLTGIGTGASVESSAEKSIPKRLLKLNQDSYCIFDVGANKGDFTKMILDNLIDENFIIHCFALYEP